MTLYEEEHLRVVEAIRFRLTTRSSGPDVYVIAVEGELDLFRTPALKDAFLDLVGRGARAIVIDLSRTTLLDSTGLALVLTLPRRIGPAGLVVVVCDNPHIRKTFEITGTDRRLTLVPEVRRALEHVDGVLPAA
jgi:anti-sigma B factor antagonist